MTFKGNLRSDLLSDSVCAITFDRKCSKVSFPDYTKRVEIIVTKIIRITLN